MKKIRMISLLLALLTASSLMSCGSEGKAPESTDAGTTKTDEETTSEYTYPDENFDGYEFKFYSPDTQFGCYRQDGLRGAVRRTARRRRLRPQPPD